MMGRQAAALPDYLAAVQVLLLASLFALAAADRVPRLASRLVLAAVAQVLPPPLRLLLAADPGRIGRSEPRNTCRRCKSQSWCMDSDSPPPSSWGAPQTVYRQAVGSDLPPSLALPAQTVYWPLADRFRASKRNRLDPSPSNRALLASNRLDQSN
jgi:hypothetical protein